MQTIDHARLGVVIDWGAKLEMMLADGMGAEGDGLGQKLKSVQDRLPDRLVSKLWFIVKVRNDVAHNAKPPKDMEDFNQACEQAVTWLNEVINKERPTREVDTGVDASAAETRTNRWEVKSPTAVKTAPMTLLRLVRSVFIAILVLVIVFASNVLTHDEPTPASGRASAVRAAPVGVRNPTAAPVAHTVEHSLSHAVTPPSTQLSVATHLLAPASVRAKSAPMVGGRAKRPDPTAPVAVRHAAPASVAHAVPLILREAQLGNAVYVKHNAVVSFVDLQAKQTAGDFGGKKWVLTGAVKNLTGVTISVLSGNASVYVPGHAQAIRRVTLNWFFGDSGLAPGQTRRFSITPGDSDFSEEKLRLPDVVNASSLGAVVTLTEVTDGMGKDHSTDTKLTTDVYKPAGRGYLEGDGFKFAPNSLVSMSNVIIVKERDSFGKLGWALRGTIHNKTSYTLGMVDIESTVYVPGQNDRIRGVKQSIYLGQSGLAAGASASFDVHLTSTLEDYYVTQPAVLNAKTLGVSTTVTDALDGMGKLLYSKT